MAIVGVDETALKTKMLNLKMGTHFSDEISNLETLKIPLPVVSFRKG